MRILYLDDSGKIHPNDPAKVVVFAGFSVDEESWHRLIRQIAGVKASNFPNRGNPNDWEIKSADYLDSNSWKRAKNRRFCFELPKILRSNGCFVYAVSLEKAKANDQLGEDKFVPLAFQRLIAKFQRRNQCRRHDRVNRLRLVYPSDGQTSDALRNRDGCLQVHAQAAGRSHLRRFSGLVPFAGRRLDRRHSAEINGKPL